MSTFTKSNISYCHKMAAAYYEVGDYETGEYYTDARNSYIDQALDDGQITKSQALYLRRFGRLS